MLRKVSLPALATGILLLATVATASAVNMFANPGFEAGAPGGGAGPGWFAFGNVYTEAAAPPAIVPYEGNQLCKMFGNFSGGFNVTGIFQEYPSAPGDQWQMSSKSRHWSGDAMVGGGAPNSNWVVQKLVFHDASDAELPGAVESTILDGTFPTDVWITNAPITNTAPAGTVKVQAFILYLQPVFDGGAAQVDDMQLLNLTATPVQPSTWGHIKSLFGDR